MQNIIQEKFTSTFGNERIPKGGEAYRPSEEN